MHESKRKAGVNLCLENKKRNRLSLSDRGNASQQGVSRKPNYDRRTDCLPGSTKIGEEGCTREWRARKRDGRKREDSSWGRRRATSTGERRGFCMEVVYGLRQKRDTRGGLKKNREFQKCQKCSRELNEQGEACNWGAQERQDLKIFSKRCWLSGGRLKKSLAGNTLSDSKKWKSHHETRGEPASGI